MSEYPHLEKMIAESKDSLVKLGRDLFACPELGLKEVKSNQILTSFLVEQGIPKEVGEADN